MPRPDGAPLPGEGRASHGLGLVIIAGDYARVHYALVMASGALAIGRSVTLFFTMGASLALARLAGHPGWHGLEPDARGRSPRAQDDAFKARRIATIDELLAACLELGGRFMVCETGLKAQDLAAGDLRPEFAARVAGIVAFYQAAADAEIVVI